jgi:uncharacterized membrane protein YdbT with pleckstrin-like domain
MRLHDDETLIHELRPERSILGIWFFTKCLAPALVGGLLCMMLFAVPAGIIWGASRNASEMPIIAVAVGALVVALVALALALVYCDFLRRTYVYFVTDQRCVFHGGILQRVERSIPYHKVTDVEMSQNIVERLLGISSVKIFTPGTGSMTTSSFGGQRAEISFVGLRDNEAPAATINEILRKFRATGE